MGGAPITPDQAVSTRPDEVVAQLTQATQELLDAIAPGDKAVWQRYLAEGSIYADEEGRVLNEGRATQGINSAA